MIIRTGKEDIQEDSTWQKIEDKVRMWLYVLMQELTKSTIFPVWLYDLLLIVEGCQFAWYALHPRLTFLWESGIFDGIRQALKFVQIDGFLADGGKSIILAILYTSFVILLFMGTIAVISAVILVRSNRSNTSAITTYFLRILNTYNFFLTTVLAFPLFFINITVIACSNDNPLTQSLDCFKGTFYVHLVVAIIGLIILVTTSVLLTFLFVDLNPWSTSPFAAPRSRLNIIKLLFKIIVCIYYVLDYSGDLQKGFIAVYCCIWLLILVLRYRQTPYYNKAIFNITLGVETSVAWISVVSLFEAFIDNSPSDNIGILFMTLGIIPWVFVVITAVKIRRENFLKVLPKSIKRAADVELYILNAVELIEKRDDIEMRMTLEGLLKLHIKQCVKDSAECPCRLITQNYLKEVEAPEKLWYTWLRSVIDDCLEKFPKSPRIHTLYASMAKEKLDNKYKALFELIEVQSNKPTIEEQFILFCYKRAIEQDLLDTDLKNNLNKINVNLIVEFQSKFIKFQTAIEVAIELHLEFWRELIETNPEIQKLQALGSRIAIAVDETFTQFKKLSSLNSNQIKMLQIYGHFLKDIANDDIEGTRIIEKANSVTKSTKLDKQLLDKIQLKYGENSDTCLLTCSGNPHNLGAVLRVNSEITRILDFSKEDVEGSNISVIMPKVVGDLHDGFMRTYLMTSEAKTIDKEMIAFPANKAGYLVPCTLMVKVLPNLNSGIRLVGFLKEIREEDEFKQEPQSEENTPTQRKKNNKKKEDEDEKSELEKESYYIMYDARSGGLYGISENCKKKFGLTGKLTLGKNRGREDFTIENIFPSLMQMSVEKLKTPEGVNILIDTSNIKQNYLFTHDDSDDYGDNKSESKYDAIRVNVTLVQDDEYAEVHLRVVRFKELDPDQGSQDDVSQNKTELKTLGGNLEVNLEDLIPANQKPAAEDIHQDADRSSVNGGGSELSSSRLEINEELRLIKDFKTLISKRSTPKSIFIIRNSVIMLGLGLIAIISKLPYLMCVKCCKGFGLSLRFKQIDEYNAGISTIADSHQRHNLMANLNFRLRKLELVARGFIIMDSTQENELRTKILSLIDGLRAISLKINDHQQTLADQGLANVESDNIVVESLLQNRTKLETRSYSSSVSQYISHATSASNASLDSFISEDVKISTKANFFFVRRNGLGSLRVKSEANADLFYGFYLDKVDSFDTKFQIILGVCIAILIIGLCIVMLIVFTVHRTATRVLSLFMFIPAAEVRLLIAKCEIYMETFLEDRKKSGSYSFAEDDLDHKKGATSKVGDNTYMEVEPNDDEGFDKTPMQHKRSISALPGGGIETNKFPIGKLQLRSRSNISEMKDDPEAKLLKSANQSVEAPLQAQLAEKAPEKTKKQKSGKKGESEENNEADANRSEKFLNSRDEYKGRVILQFISIGGIFMAYFLGDYFDNLSTLTEMKVSLNHFKLNVVRMPNIRFVEAFTLEELAEGASLPVYNYTDVPYTDLRSLYRERTLTNLKDLSKSRREGFSSDFDAYFVRYDGLSSGNLCELSYSTTTATKTACAAVGGGLLTEGLVISITRIEQISFDIIKEFNKTAKALQDQKDKINSVSFKQSQDLVDYIMPALESLLSEFNAAFTNFTNRRNTLDKMKFAVFIILIISMYIIVWNPYRRTLNDKIFKTKGMLRMIPIELIVKDENLKSMFFSGTILQAVK